MKAKAKVGVIGGAGYAGGELLRLLSQHDGVEVAQAVSATFPGKPVSSVHPGLRRLSGLEFSSALAPEGLDAVFLASGHGESTKLLPELLKKAPKLKVVDLAADFRLDSRFVYGLSELERARIRAARLVANPGCFATAVALACAPLARAGLKGPVSATAVTGSSGSGASPSATTHHPAREGSMRAYKPLKHQHLAELAPLLGGLDLSLVTVSGPFVRGIYAVCQLPLPAGWDEARVREAYEQAYEGCAFVSLVEAPPDLKAVAGTNHCDLHVAVEGRKLAVISALDNLVKGAAGQAVQNLNLMLDLPEETGLELAGAYP